MSAMSETCKNRVLFEREHKVVQKKELRHLFMDSYQSNTLQYNNKPEEDIFPRAYHTLVHCPIPAIFDTLLELEQSYAIAIQELQTASDHELVAIQARQAQEIESASSSSTSLTGSPNSNTHSSNNDMTTIFTRQVEEMEVFQATWQSDILQTQQTQRQEYREFVIELYKEYQSRLASLSDEQHLKSEDNALGVLAVATSAVAEKKLDGKEMVAAAASRVRQWDTNGDGEPEAGAGAAAGSNKSTHSDTKSNNTNPIITRRRTGSLASSLGSIASPNLQQQQHSPNELASLVRTASFSSNDESMSAATAESVKNIQEMGFQKEQAETALVLSNQNMEAAIGLLLENPEKVDAYIAEQKFQQQQLIQQQQFQTMVRPPASSSTPYRRSHSLSQVPRPTFVTEASSATAPVLPTTSSSSIHSRQSSENANSRRLSLTQRTPTFLNIMSSGTAKAHSSPNLNVPSQNNSVNTNNSNSNNAGGKSWNPISFLQQQKQAMENTNLSSVRKLGGWLGKAMENFGIENDENEIKQGLMRGRARRQQQHQQQQQTPQLVESFTIMMGTAQIKSSHNLRLLVTDEASEVFHPVYDPPREMAYRAETATKLYTSHLSAAIVLVEVNELTRRPVEGWRLYKTGKGSNKALFERCQQSTEFHFADIETQLSVVEEDFKDHPVTEGSFFVTKHSNLPSTQVVFHLLVNSAALTTTDLSNRHPLIIGLRNILKMTTQFDISSLSIPLLLLPDRFIEQPDHYMTMDHHQSWLQKRGEVVMKCIKGFLIENSRSGKRVQNEGLDRAESMGGGGMRNVEFLLPSRPDVYTMGVTALPRDSATATALSSASNGSTPPPITATTSTDLLSGSSSGAVNDGSMSNNGGTPHHEVEVAFQQFRTLLVNLFRTS
ncbi:hypothetical protein HMPREF1544_02103 [Mucor circinelloides 1006PhL]|uniref:UBA domain-containing protein n=1 Tax=Mucor circinelloides f. circinelloides (strain 1006PhL) TaxID=1220926 RepID=S2JM38_MUCC1|nr:hypothetical protein HMPREF1544_02103 [Mucor circinelloides 1006PhL]